MRIQELSRVMPLPSVCAIVTHKKKILLSQRRHDHYYRPGFWQTAGGMIDHGEKLWQTAVREFKEEVGDLRLCFMPNHEYVENGWTKNPSDAEIVHIDDTVMDGCHWICLFLHLELRHEGLPHNPETKKHGNWYWFTRDEVFNGPIPAAGPAFSCPLVLMPGVDRAMMTLMSKGIL